MRGVDLNHRPLGYEPNAAAHAKRLRPAKSKQTLRFAPTQLFRFSLFRTQLADNWRTNSLKFLRACGRHVADAALRNVANDFPQVLALSEKTAQKGARKGHEWESPESRFPPSRCAARVSVNPALPYQS